MQSKKQGLYYLGIFWVIQFSKRVYVIIISNPKHSNTPILLVEHARIVETSPLRLKNEEMPHSPKLMISDMDQFFRLRIPMALILDLHKGGLNKIKMFLPWWLYFGDVPFLGNNKKNRWLWRSHSQSFLQGGPLRSL